MTGFRILTVCTGNVHRSALAAELLRTWAGWYRPAADVTVTSAGTHAAVGAGMDAEVVTMIAALGGDGHDHRARQLADADIEAADLVLTAARSHRDDVLARVPSALRRTFTIREAGRIALLPGATPGEPRDLAASVDLLAEWRHRVASSRKDDDIADPQGRGVQGFERMAKEELPPLARLGGVLFGMPRPDLDAYLAAAADPAALWSAR